MESIKEAKAYLEKGMKGLNEGDKIILASKALDAVDQILSPTTPMKIDQSKYEQLASDGKIIETLKKLNFMDRTGDKHSKIWKSLDVSILQKLIFEEILDINQENLENHVFYTRDFKDTINFVNEGKYNFSFIINPTKIKELKTIAEAGEHMPQKSTYFLPKMLSGLVMYKMNI